MTQWEYLSVTEGRRPRSMGNPYHHVYKPDDVSGPSSTDPNSLGKDGWEMVSATMTRGPDEYEHQTTTWYKREKRADPSSSSSTEMSGAEIAETARWVHDLSTPGMTIGEWKRRHPKSQ